MTEIEELIKMLITAVIIFGILNVINTLSIYQRLREKQKQDNKMNKQILDTLNRIEAQNRIEYNNIQQNTPHNQQYQQYQQMPPQNNNYNSLNNINKPQR
ncbi:hypothetical protein ACTQ3J_01565 [Oscillospiraceae bacterium LCP25S3_E3]